MTENSSYLQTCFYVIIFPYPDLHGLFLIYLSYMQKKTNEGRHAWNLKEIQAQDTRKGLAQLLFSFFFGFFMIKNYLQMVSFHNYDYFHSNKLTGMQNFITYHNNEVCHSKRTTLGIKIRGKLRLRLIEVYRVDWTNW